MSFRKEFLKELREKRTSYKDMIDFCCDSLILNNDIICELSKNDYYFDMFCGSDREFLTDFYQYYIVSYRDAERLAEYTTETVFYNEDLDLYLLAVSHFGTGWSCVPASWKNPDDVED